MEVYPTLFLTVALVAVLSVTGLLYRLFLNVLLTAAVVTLTAWTAVLLAGFALFIGVPLYCGFTGRDLETVFQSFFG